MNLNYIDIYFFASIFSLAILLYLLKRQDSILHRYEAKEKYKGFYEEVYQPISTSGGIFNATVLLPWFDFTDKDEFEKKHLITKNWLILTFWIILITMFVVVYIYYGIEKK